MRASGGRKYHDELGALAGPGTVRRYLSAVQLYETARHAQSYPQATPVAVTPEWLEHMRKDINRDAFTGIAHADRRHSMAGLEAHFDGPASIRVLESILENIREHLVDSDTVCSDQNRGRRRRISQVHCALFGKLAKDAGQVFDDRSKIEACDFKLKIAATRPLSIQQIVHQPPHVNELPLDDSSRFCSPGVLGCVRHQRYGHFDRGKWMSQFMRYQCDDIELRTNLASTLIAWFTSNCALKSRGHNLAAVPMSI
jgi:hypothetical protein